MSTEIGEEMSIFDGLTKINPTALSKVAGTSFLVDIIEEIEDGTHADKVKKVRALEQGSEAHAKAKKALGGFTVSGVFPKKRGGFPETHTGLMQVDLDGKDNPDLTVEKMRAKVIEDPSLVACFTSPSGDGLKVIVKTGVAIDRTDHVHRFESMKAGMTRQGLTVDDSCKDPARLCFYSHDPSAFYRSPGDAEAIPLIPKTTEPVHRERQVEGISYPLPVAKRALEAIEEKTGRPPYELWLGLTAGMRNSYGSDGIAAMADVFPEERKGEYEDKFSYLPKLHNAGFIINQAKKLAGWEATTEEKEAFMERLGTDSYDETIPDNVFPIPANKIGNTQAAEKIFSVIGATKKLFIRGANVNEIISANGVDSLAPVTPERFCGLVEGYGHRTARKEGFQDKDGRIRYAWRSKTYPLGSAKVILETDAAREHLPPIRQMTNCPIMTPVGEMLGKGYHDHAGGTYISTGAAPQTIPVEKAIEALKGLLVDFDFPTKSDFSRAFASLISPAMKMGGWITDDFPLDLAEADKSQSGKTYRQKLVCRLYNEAPSSITLSRGGVGSIDENIAGALLQGRPFLTLGNIRGKIDSPIMEEALRGSGHVTCRGFRKVGEVDTGPFLWQLSTNGAELTPDLANRAIVTKIRKRPDEYEWKKFPEGDLERHVIANQPFYLACVFSVIKAWSDAGGNETSESRHDFRKWCRVMDGICQFCGLAPLLDGHREQQRRTANPNLQWVRNILLKLPEEKRGEELTTMDLAKLAEEEGIEFPGNPNSKDDPWVRAGKIFGRIFREAESNDILVDNFVFSRFEIIDFDDASRTVKKYTVKSQE